MRLENACAAGVRSLSVEYRRRLRFLSQGVRVRALDNVDLVIPHGVCWALTGPSGCGKSTLARCLARWDKPTSGEVFGDADVQLIMQDPGASLNPRFTAEEIIDEPLVVRHSRQRRANELMERVGLDPSWSSRRSTEFSGGQRARLAIARALAAMRESSPGMLIFDESFSSLDCETLDGIFRLLKTLQLTHLIITHEVDLVADVVDGVIGMSNGTIAKARSA